MTIILLISSGWGFFAHRTINRLAVFTLPPEMIPFYKYHIRSLTDMAVDPDRRRYAVPGEACRHFIDVDRVDPCFLDGLTPWHEAVQLVGVDSLERHGIVPWQVMNSFYALRNAFIIRDVRAILRHSADLGHYAGDASVPLHTTSNYNGQQTGQSGIHGFWESRLPELFSDRYDFYVGSAFRPDNLNQMVWATVRSSHAAVDSVLRLEKELDRKTESPFSFEARGVITTRVYSIPYSTAYHRVLSGMVERRMRIAIRLTGCLWYTAWLEAGQPDLNTLLNSDSSTMDEAERRRLLQEWKSGVLPVREHEAVDHEPEKR